MVNGISSRIRYLYSVLVILFSTSILAGCVTFFQPTFPVENDQISHQRSRPLGVAFYRITKESEQNGKNGLLLYDKEWFFPRVIRKPLLKSNTFNEVKFISSGQAGAKGNWIPDDQLESFEGLNSSQFHLRPGDIFIDYRVLPELTSNGTPDSDWVNFLELVSFFSAGIIPVWAEVSYQVKVDLYNSRGEKKSYNIDTKGTVVGWAPLALFMDFDEYKSSTIGTFRLLEPITIRLINERKIDPNWL